MGRKQPYINHWTENPIFQKQMSAFERPDGLVKRNRGAATGGFSETRRDSFEKIDDNEKESKVDDFDDVGEDEDMGDKHTRLNLMEQVLLLGIKDREVISI